MAYVGNTPFGPSCPSPTRVFAQVNTGFRSVRRSVGGASNLVAQVPAQLGVGGELTVVEPLVPGGVVGEDRVLGGIRQKLVGHLRPQRCLGDVQVSTAGALRQP